MFSSSLLISNQPDSGPFKDPFNRPNEVLDVSADWQIRNEPGKWKINGNLVEHANGVPANIRIATTTTGLTGPDYYTQSDLKFSAISSDYFGIAVRQVDYSTTDSDFYFGAMKKNTSEIFIYKRTSGVWKQLSSTSFTVATATPYTVKISANTNGSAVDLELWVDGVSKLTTSDSDSDRILVQGKGALANGGGGNTIETTWNNFEMGML